MRAINRTWPIALLIGLGVLTQVACRPQQTKTTVPSPLPEEKNEVVLYLDGAERQAETDDQRAEILRALEDLRTLDPVALEKQRYADYGGVPGQWTLAGLLQKYFVPRELRGIDEDALYRDAQSQKARDVIEKQIRALREGRQVIPIP